jgi:hypothetical protein
VSPRRPEIPAVLARHGIDPAADEVTLLAELAARGWEVRVEDRRDDGVRLQPRYRAVAFRQRPSGTPGRRPPWLPDHHQGSGQTADGALRQVLAAVLAREEESG